MRYFYILLSLVISFSPLYLNTTENVVGLSEYSFETITVSYGSSFKKNSIDANMTITDNFTNEMIERIVYDYGGNEYYKYLADIGNEEFILICERYSISEDIFEEEYIDTLLTKYNAQGEVLLEKRIEEKALNYSNHNSYLIISYSDKEVIYDSNMELVDAIFIDSEYLGEYSARYQGEAYINQELVEEINISNPGSYNILIKNEDYEYSYSITILPIITILGEYEAGFYIGDVTISSGGDIYLNNIQVISGYTINVPGNYTILIKGENDFFYTEDICVLPIVQYSTLDNLTDLENGLVISRSITIYSNAISMSLNGEEYNSEEINETGSFNLVLYCNNNMIFQMSFTISPNVEGITDLGIYEIAEFNIFGEGILNGKKVSGSIQVDEPGEYKLDLLMGNQIYETYNFSVVQSDNIQNIEPTNGFNFNYVFIGVIVIGALIFLRKK